jgi:hypothetical protein
MHFESIGHQVFMFPKNVNVCTKDCQLARKVGNRPSFLDDTCAYLKVRGLGVYTKPFIMVGASYALTAISKLNLQILLHFVCP